MNKIKVLVIVYFFFAWVIPVESIRKIEIADIKEVELCELIKNEKAYDSKMIRLKARMIIDWHGYKGIKKIDCMAENDRFCLKFSCKNKLLCKEDEITQKTISKITYGIVDVIMIAKFMANHKNGNSEYCISNSTGSKYQLVIDKIEEVESPKN